MPVMDERVRKARAERLLQLRAEGVSPAGAWLEVKPNYKGSEKSAADLTRREIGRYRKRYGVVDAPGEDGEPEDDEAGGPNGAAPNGAGAEVTGDVAAKPAKATKPVKLCLGVEDRPCGKEITGRSPRCDDCRKEHGKLKKKAQNQGSHRRNKEARKERRIGRQEAKSRQQKEKERQEAERRRKEEERRRQQQEERERQEAERKRREEAEAAKAMIEAALAELRAELRAEKERIARLPHMIATGHGCYVLKHPDGQLEYVDNHYPGRSRFLEPGEPPPVWTKRSAG